MHCYTANLKYYWSGWEICTWHQRFCAPEPCQHTFPTHSSLLLPNGTERACVPSTQEEQLFPAPKESSNPPMYYQAYVCHTQGVIKTTHKFPYEAYCLIRRNLLQKTSLKCALLEVKQPSYPTYSRVRGELSQPSYLSPTGRLSLANPTLHL